MPEDKSVFDEIVERRAKRLGMSVQEVLAGHEEPAFLKAAERRAQRLGLTLEEVEQRDLQRMRESHYPGLHCLLPDEWVEYRETGNLPGERLEHVKSCGACGGLYSALLPSPDRFQPFLAAVRAAGEEVAPRSAEPEFAVAAASMSLGKPRSEPRLPAGVEFAARLTEAVKYAARVIGLFPVLTLLLLAVTQRAMWTGFSEWFALSRATSTRAEVVFFLLLAALVAILTGVFVKDLLGARRALRFTWVGAATVSLVCAAAAGYLVNSRVKQGKAVLEQTEERVGQVMMLSLGQQLVTGEFPVFATSSGALGVRVISADRTAAEYREELAGGRLGHVVAGVRGGVGDLRWEVRPETSEPLARLVAGTVRTVSSDSMTLRDWQGLDHRVAVGDVRPLPQSGQSVVVMIDSESQKARLMSFVPPVPTEHKPAAAVTGVPKH